VSEKEREIQVSIRGVINRQFGMLTGSPLTWSNESIRSINSPLTWSNESIRSINSPLTWSNESIGSINSPLTWSNESIGSINSPLTCSSPSKVVKELLCCFCRRDFRFYGW
jgi:hypothetical protein